GRLATNPFPSPRNAVTSSQASPSCKASYEAAMQPHNLLPVGGQDALSASPLRHWLQKRAMLLATIAFLAATAILLWYLVRRISDLYDAMAKQGAALQAEAISEFRQVYTAEVVDRLKKHGIEARSDYQKNDQAIPLPVTMTIELGERLTQKRPGHVVHLF